MYKIKQNNKINFMKKDILDPGGSRGSKKEKFFSMVILFLIIVAIGGFAILRSDVGVVPEFLRGQLSPPSEELEEGSETEENLKSEDEFSVDQIDQNNSEEIQTPERSEGEILTNIPTNQEEILIGGVYSMRANHGEGLTHLTRRAFNNHLEEIGGENLTAEHAVYIEDYIQKNLNHSTGWLHLDEIVEISEDLIDEAIGLSYNLTDSQLQNLSQYIR